MSNYVFNLSVHEFVDFLLRDGDIDTRVFNVNTLVRGTKMHSYYQALQNEKYEVEVLFKRAFQYDQYTFVLQGRADGVITNGDEVTIEELKTTNSDLQTFYENNKAWHLAQAKCYALMYALEHNKSRMHITLTYLSQIDLAKTVHTFTFTTKALQEDINTLFALYISYFSKTEAYQSARNETLATLTFPFAKMHEGQALIIEEITKSLKRTDRLFINAPTGSGKTLATLFPSILDLAKHEKAKIFYLTAKGSGQEQAVQALTLLQTQGLKLKSIVLHAKEKMCINDKIRCNPDECPFTRNYYGKIKEAMFDTFCQDDIFTPDKVIAAARKHEVCPFEFQLDLSLLCDVVIADYNYVFDPFVYLRRYFDNKNGKYIVLIDEAHNLHKRVQDNYSFDLDFNELFKVRPFLKGPEHAEIRKTINALARVLRTVKKSLEPEITPLVKLEPILQALLERFLSAGSDYMYKIGANLSEAFSDFYFNVNKFLKLFENYNDNFHLFITNDEQATRFFTLNLRALNATPFIVNTLEKIDNVIMFSATLAPKEYYTPLLAINEYMFLDVPNPFLKENLLVLYDDVTSLFYKDRDKTIKEVYEKITTAISMQVGNYIIYLPSFAYLEQIIPYFAKSGVNIVVQQRVMSEFDKQQFLASFVTNPAVTTVGFAVIGGSFSEGVDLVAERLSGIALVGVGFPAVTYENSALQTYYDVHGENGFNFTYVYPAINKILQTMGRVIRSESDRGFVLLIDKRYGQNPYFRTIQNYNAMVVNVHTKADIKTHLAAFLLN